MSQTRFLRYIAILALTLSVASALSPAPLLAHEGPGDHDDHVIGPGGAPPAGSGPVDIAGFVRGIDGDTMETWIDGSRVGIGLIGINVPEGNTTCGVQATSMLQNMLYAGAHLEEDSQIVFDERLRRMYYGYTIEGQSLAHAMVAAGMARASGEGKDAAELLALEDEARLAGDGCVWNADAGDTIVAEPASSAPESDGRGLLALPSGFQSLTAASGLNFPTDFAFLPDGRILITEKSGIVRIAVDGSVLSTPFIDLSAQVNDYWDRGLLSVAVDPDFVTNGYVYFLFTYEHNASDYSGLKTGRLIRVTASGNTASSSSEVVILGNVVGSSCDDFPVGADCIPSDGPSHSTGGMEFAADGTLFVTLGEGANFNASTPQALRAQNLQSLGGKLLRITATGQGVSGNPFWTGNPNDIQSKIWATGLRNAYRFSLRPGDGTPYVGDVGWVSWEEINVATAGANLGWPCYEGTFQQSAYSSYSACQQLYSAGNATAPVISWDHTTGGSAVTGGVFYTGSSYPAEYQGAYFYGDYARNFIRYATMTAGNLVATGPFNFDDSAGGPVDFEIGPEDDLYYLSITTGEVRHIVFNGGPGGSESAFVSDLTWDSNSNGWGPVERDQSNGEDAAGDGGPLTINGATFTKGLGVHAASEVVISLDGSCSQFISSVGVDDEVGPNGSVVFDVYSGATLLATSGVLTGADDPQTLTVNLSGVTQLRLVVTDAGDNVYWDHANWADAWIECGQDQIAPTVVSTSPPDGATGVPVSANITATFSEPIDEASLTGNVALLESGADPVSATVTYNSNTSTMTINPDASLALDTSYSVRITGGTSGVADLAGNPLDGDVMWSFTTSDNGGPVPVIASPLSTDTFIVGSEIVYSGSATDAQGQPLPASALRWRVLIYHCNHINCHAHQVIDETGTTGGAFTVPDHGDQYYFEIQLTATDAGQSNTTTVEVHPETVDVTLLSSPPGLEVNLAGEQAPAPLTRPSVVGSTITVAAPSPQGSNTFESWSDGGAAVHTVLVGTSDLTLTATFSGGNPGGEIYLSDMTPTNTSNHWGPVELDQSNGEQAAGDGGPITIGGVVFAKGLGVHAPSTVSYAIDGCSLLQASIGIDDEVGSNGSVVFEVRGDGVSLYQSSTLTGASSAENIAVDITGVSNLDLLVTDAGDNVYWDHADWGDARITCGQPPLDTTPPSVTTVTPADGASGVPTTTTAIATFSEAIDPATLDGNFTLAVQGSGPTVASLSYDSANTRATLTPSSALLPDTTYVVTASGGTGGITDVAGNPLASDVTWIFTTAPVASGSEIFISDMTWSSQSNGWGPVERDQSNGEQAAGDGGPLTIGGVVYAKGLGAHANSEVVVMLDGTCGTFAAFVGVDDEVGNNGTVTFEVWGDGARIAQVTGVTGSGSAIPVTADITGVTTLRLVVTDAGDNVYWDHADWGDAKVICGEPPQDTTPPVVTSITPPDGASSVPVTTTLTARFSEDLDPASLTGNVELREQGASTATSIQITYSATTDVLTITPDAGLQPGTTYVLTLDGAPGGIADLAGNSLATDVTSTFTTAEQATGGDVYISDMAWVSSTNHWGPVERDQSNGEQALGDGGPITIGGSVFTKGIGVHADSEVIIALDGSCSTFAAMVGIDAEVGNRGSVIFQVFGDSTLLHTSPLLEGGDAPHSIQVDITGHAQLRLVVADGGDNPYFDHADWGDARLICDGGGPGDTTPPAIVNRSPVGGASGVSTAVSITATFSEALAPVSIDGAFQLRISGGSIVPSTSTYSASTLTAMLTPDATLAEGTEYEVTILGGPSGVTDVAGNPLASDAVWTFTTDEQTSTPPLFDDPFKVATGTNTHGVSAADVNEDGNLDLVVATTGADTIVILLGDGNGAFAASGSYPTGVHPKFATTGDFNGDGRLDFASANQDDAQR